MPLRSERSDFLIAMYEQLMNDINRHIMVVWQSIATLVAAVAVFSFVKDNIIPFDIAVSIVILICVWLLCHVYDAGYWYNRNLVIISNIERQFLEVTDLREIHYYFGSHRPTNKLISHLRYQLHLAVGTSIIFLGYHFYSVIYMAMIKCQQLSFINATPWIVAVYGVVNWHRVKQDNARKYSEFLQNSPGKVVDNSGVSFGSGHGH
jgi:hypothetical protein